jgi:hypothetical protein
MALVIAELGARGLLFLDSRTTAQSVAADEARRAGVAHASRDVFLDNDVDIDAIRRQLALVEQIARRRGSAVAIGHPHDATIEALRSWLPSLEQRGFVLVPISSVVAHARKPRGLGRRWGHRRPVAFCFTSGAIHHTIPEAKFPPGLLDILSGGIDELQTGKPAFWRSASPNVFLSRRRLRVRRRT